MKASVLFHLLCVVFSGVCGGSKVAEMSQISPRKHKATTSRIELDSTLLQADPQDASSSPTSALVPTKAPHTFPPTSSPSSVPTAADEQAPHTAHAWLRIIMKTLLWLLLAAVSVMLFGALMNHRYRLWYALRRTLARCGRSRPVLWVLQQLRLVDPDILDTNLSSVIFEDETDEALLGGA